MNGLLLYTVSIAEQGARPSPSSATPPTRAVRRPAVGAFGLAFVHQRPMTIIGVTPADVEPAEQWVPTGEVWSTNLSNSRRKSPKHVQIAYKLISWQENQTRVLTSHSPNKPPVL